MRPFVEEGNPNLYFLINLAFQLVYEISFSPIAEHNIIVIKIILFQSFDSPKTIIPIRALPTTPIPVHIAYPRSEEHTSELQSRGHLVCRLLLEKKKKKI